ncbi:MAG: Ger(x)C family spore germination C-terminal domain-containing protein, partial [Alicyclobacillus sp.]|nr:Ger(x)C family spore germination C-terminal domain-containing protein [Alicyclobacillus sp.]
MAGSGPVTFRAHNLVEALTMANSSVERTLSLTHLGQIILGEDLVKSGLLNQMDALTRFRELRPTLYIGVAKGSAHDIIAADQPVVERTPSRMPDSIADIGRRTGLFPVVALHDLVNAVSEPNAGVILPLINVNKKVKEDPKGQQGIEGSNLSFTPGEIERSGGNPVEWMGAAVVRNGQWVGALTGEECVILSLLEGKIKRTQITLPAPQGDNRTVSLTVKRERAPDIAVDPGQVLRVLLHVPLEADVVYQPQGADFADPVNRQKLEQYCDQILEQRFTQTLTKMLHDYKTDAARITDHARQAFPTYQAFLAYPW